MPFCVVFYLLLLCGLQWCSAQRLLERAFRYRFVDENRPLESDAPKQTPANADAFGQARLLPVASPPRWNDALGADFEKGVMRSTPVSSALGTATAQLTKPLQGNDLAGIEVATDALRFAVLRVTFRPLLSMADQASLFAHGVALNVTMGNIISTPSTDVVLFSEYDGALRVRHGAALVQDGVELGRIVFSLVQLQSRPANDQDLSRALLRPLVGEQRALFKPF